MKRMVWSTLTALLLAVPLAAIAADGYVTGDISMRAGPDVQYPAVTVLPAGTEVSIQGCTEGWEWCDVIAYDNRGWVAGNYIQYEYDDQPVLLPSYGARIGIPVITFVIGTYWGAHYRHRSFYRDRTRWYSRPIRRRPPPRPFDRPLRPIHGGPARPGYRPQPRPPAHRPPINRPKPNRPVTRPSTRPQTGINRPPVNKPKPNHHVTERPATRPQTGVNRPPFAGGNHPGNRPSSGARPGTRPAMGKPQTKPSPKKKPKDQNGGH